MVNINDLPIEVFDKIVALVDEIDPTAAVADIYQYGKAQLPLRTPQQTATLRSVSLVCRRWRRSGQRGLCQRVEIRKPENLKKLADSLLANLDLALAVCTLYVHTLFSPDSSMHLAVCLSRLACLKSYVLMAGPRRAFLDMSELDSVVPNRLNSQLGYFGMEGVVSRHAGCWDDPTSSTALCSLPHSLVRLDIRSSRLPSSSIISHPGLKVLCLDGLGLLGRTDVIESILSLTKIVRVELMDVNLGSLPAAYRNVTTDLKLLRDYGEPPKLLMTDFPSLKSLEVFDKDFDPEDMDYLPDSLQQLIWTFNTQYQEAFLNQQLATVHTLLQRFCSPTFLPRLEAMPVINATVNPSQGWGVFSITSETLELVEKAANALTLRKLPIPSVEHTNEAVPSKFEAYMRIFPPATV